MSQVSLKRILRAVLILAVLSSNIGCDQISKNIVREELNYHEQVSLVGNVLTLIKVENTGAFLSLGNSWPKPIKVFLLMVLPLIALGLATLYLMTRRNLNRISMIGICFVIGGGIGNVYDRIVYGSVTDFLYLDFGIFRTGIFNMADVSVMTGVCVILIDVYFNEAAESKHR